MRSKKIKIAVIFPSWSESLFNKSVNKATGGANVQMYLISKELASHKESYETYSLIPKYDEINFDDKDYFELVPTFKETDKLLKKVFVFFRKLREVSPDIIIQHGLTIFSCILSLYCWAMQKKFIYMVASDIETQGKYQSNAKKCNLFRFLLLPSTIIITQNQFQQQEFLRKYNKESTIIYNGFSLPSDIKKEKDLNTILWVARADKCKRPELFIELAKLNPGVKFMMICPKIQDENYYSSLKKQASGSKNLEFIEFVPFDKIGKYFEQSKVFVNTSDYEGYPQTFIQATMYGLPILSLNVDPDNFITKNRCGAVCKGELSELSKHLKELLEDKALYENISVNARKYALEYHDIRNTVLKLLKLC